MYVPYLGTETKIGLDMQDISWRIEQERQGELLDHNSGITCGRQRVRRVSDYSEVSRKIQAYGSL